MPSWLIITVLLCWLVTAPVAGAANLTSAVRTAWKSTSRRQPLEERIQSLATTLRQGGQFFTIQIADLDDDSLPDLLVVPAAPAAKPWLKGQPFVYRGADLRTNRFLPYAVGRPGDFRRVERVADINQNGRTELVITFEPSGSAAAVPWFIYQWDGDAFRQIFDTWVSNWTGRHDLWLEPGRIRLTCGPMGVYDHHSLPHRTHSEVWTWKEREYQLTSHQAPPPSSSRQAVNDAEAYFRRQDYAEALPLYRLALRLPGEPDDRDWAPYIHFRLGQTLALLGRLAESKDEFGVAAKGPGLVGRAAQRTLMAFTQPHLASVLAAPLRLTGTDEAYHPPTSTVTVEDLAPPAVLIQSFLQHGGDWQQLQDVGIPVTTALATDLNGDGRPEVWASMAEPLYNPKSFLAVVTKAGWRVGEVPEYGDRPLVRPVAGTKLSELYFERLATDPQSSAAFRWDGRFVIRKLWGPGGEETYTDTLQPPAVRLCREPVTWVGEP